MSTDTITDLQRQLLAILKGNIRTAGAWHSRAGILGYPPNVAPLPDRMSDVRELRRRILAIKPDACIYGSWGGPMP